jgi:hypothetical protein
MLGLKEAESIALPRFILPSHCVGAFDENNLQLLQRRKP